MRPIACLTLTLIRRRPAHTLLSCRSGCVCAPVWTLDCVPWKCPAHFLSGAASYVLILSVMILKFIRQQIKSMLNCHALLFFSVILLIPVDFGLLSGLFGKCDFT